MEQNIMLLFHNPSLYMGRQMIARIYFDQLLKSMQKKKELIKKAFKIGATQESK